MKTFSSQNVINNFETLFFSSAFFKVSHRCALKRTTFLIGQDHTPWQLVHLLLKMTDGKTQTQKEGAMIK